MAHYRTAWYILVPASPGWVHMLESEEPPDFLPTALNARYLLERLNQRFRRFWTIFAQFLKQLWRPERLHSRKPSIPLNYDEFSFLLCYDEWLMGVETAGDYGHGDFRDIHFIPEVTNDFLLKGAFRQVRGGQSRVLRIEVEFFHCDQLYH